VEALILHSVARTLARRSALRMAGAERRPGRPRARPLQRGPRTGRPPGTLSLKSPTLAAFFRKRPMILSDEIFATRLSFIPYPWRLLGAYSLLNLF